MEQIKASKYVKEIPDFLKKEYPKKITLSSILLKVYWSQIWVKPMLLIKKKKKKNTSLYDAMEEFPDIRTKQQKNYIPKKQIISKPKKDNTQKAIAELQQLKREINYYFCIGLPKQQDYYTNGCADRSIEYQHDIHSIKLSKTNIISSYMKPYMPALQQELMQHDLDVKYNFPMNGEVGFITIKTRN